MPLKCLCLGPDGSFDPNGHQGFNTNKDFFRHRLAHPEGTDTSTVKLWARWPLLQPRGDYPIGVDPPPGTYNLPNPPSYYLQALDNQIAQARSTPPGAAGGSYVLGVLLIAYETPEWANANTRSTYASQRFWKSGEWAFPDQVGTDSPYGRWIRFLIDRYLRPWSSPYVDFLGVVNEPNHQGWPQLDASGLDYAACMTAQMFQTAATALKAGPVKNDWMPYYGRLNGPELADKDVSNRETTSYLDFTRLLIKSLRNVAFIDDLLFTWSHHTYTDFTQGTLDRCATLAVELEKLGWQANRTDRYYRPTVMFTEGGIQRWMIPASGTQKELMHVDLLDGAWGGIKILDGADARYDFPFMTQYLVYTVAGYDCGIRYDYPSGGARMPAFDKWAEFDERYG